MKKCFQIFIQGLIIWELPGKKYNEIGGFGNLRHGQDIEFSNRIKNLVVKLNLLKMHWYIIVRSSLKQFVKQVFNWGVARVNLAKIDLSMLEPVHFLPSICCILFCFLIVNS